MTGLEKLETLIQEKGGFITPKLAGSHNIHREYINEFVKQGKLEKVAYGVYITPDTWEDQMFIYQLRRNKIIYSHETALFFHDLTDRDPIAYCVTVPSGYNTKQLRQEGLKVHTVKKELFELGVCTKQTIFGNSVKTYDLERTICDTLRNRNNQDVAIVSDALQRYSQRKDKNLHRLMKYAKYFRVLKVLKPYLQVLI